jgi:hypothetical protein
MSIITPSTAFASGLAAVPGDLIWRLSVGQYHAMIRTGILTPDHPVELLDGWLVLKMPKNPPHRVATRLTCKALERVMPAGWYVDQQEPITTQNSEPEPMWSWCGAIRENTSTAIRASATCRWLW